MALRRRKKKVNKEEIEAKKAKGKPEEPKELEAAGKSDAVQSASDEGARRPLFYKQPVPLSGPSSRPDTRATLDRSLSPSARISWPLWSREFASATSDR